MEILQALTYKPPAAALELVVNSGVDTLAKLAFCSPYVPGQADDTQLVQAVKAMLGRDATVGKMSVLRRLLQEAYSMTAAELRQSVDRTEDAPVKKWEFPKIRGTIFILGVPIIRTIVFWGSILGSPYLGKLPSWPNRIEQIALQGSRTVYPASRFKACWNRATGLGFTPTPKP